MLPSRRKTAKASIKTFLVALISSTGIITLKKSMPISLDQHRNRMEVQRNAWNNITMKQLENHIAVA